LLAPPPLLYLASLTTLDVSNNEMRDLPGLSSLPNLTRLSIQRNWFADLPSEIDGLPNLVHLDASRNFLRPNAVSLRYDSLCRLMRLEVLDLSYNQKIRRVDHRVAIREGIRPSGADVFITAWEETMTTPPADPPAAPPREGGGEGAAGLRSTTAAYVGASAAVRDALLLRSQLEPWGTFALRRRLVSDFGESPTDPAVVGRAEVMRRLLGRYRDEGLSYYPDDYGDGDGDDDGRGGSSDLGKDGGGRDDPNAAVGKRRVIRIDGAPVRDELVREILAELRGWRGDAGRGGGRGAGGRERPSVRAECYMILRAPPGPTAGAGDDDGGGGPADDDAALPLTPPSRRAMRRTKKMEGNRGLWSLALRALREADPAARCSEVAVTYGFSGSPHIDKQNSSFFYGLSVGDFDEGTGCVAVECSARVIAEVDTRNRLGRIDGRYPHWVTHYDPGQERFSLIYYDTMSTFEPPGPAIFCVP
jgi:hypothetical protein